MAKILIVEDKQSLAQMLKKSLTREGYEVSLANGVSSANELISQDNSISLILCDLKLPDGDGLSVLRTATKRANPLAVIMMTAYGSIDVAVKAVKEGAFDFITKPFDIDHLLNLIKEALSKSPSPVHGQPKTSSELDTEIIGVSQAWIDVIERAKKVADMKTTVLILGESGTGKELIARFIHNQSSRKGQPFVAVNCSAIPKDLVENELFGHEKGAFTGAVDLKIGRFEMAHRGTIFLDEIGDMDITLQAKILRVLQESEFLRVGGSKTIKVDVRLIAASNKDLKREVERGNFRQDLYYRLNVFPILIPPLRERRQDIEPLALYYTSFFARQLNKPSMRLSDEAIRLLVSYHWPGNVRELRNSIERAVILCETATIGVDLFELPVSNHSEKESQESLHHISTNAQRQAEIALIRDALNKTGGNKTRAAELLKISYKTLLNKIKEYNL